MGLEENEHAPAAAQGSKRCGHLRGVMRVVVHYLDTTDLAAPLQSSTHAPEVGQCTLRLRAVDPGELERHQRRRRVCPIVIACHCELAGVGIELVPARRRVCLSEERLEEELDLAMRRECRVVVEINVRNDGDLRLEMLERAV